MLKSLLFAAGIANREDFDQTSVDMNRNVPVFLTPVTVGWLFWV